MNALANSVHHHVSVFSLSMGAPLCQEEGLAGLISLFPEPCAGGGAMQGCWESLILGPVHFYRTAGPHCAHPHPHHCLPRLASFQTHSLTLRDRDRMP